METIYTNCRIITREEIVTGTLVMEDAVIKAVDDSLSRSAAAVDLQGDFLLPGLIEMHTDNLEKNIQPRPGVIWPSLLSAVMAHDAQIAGAGITTVFDAIAVGGLRQSSLRSRIFAASVEAISRARKERWFKADHYLHLRCEVSDEYMGSMLHPHIDNPAIRLISLMDHTPGQRQWSDLDKWRLYHRDKRWTEEEAQAVIAERKAMQERYADKHRRLAVELARARKIPLASHDDTSAFDVQAAAADGIAIAEFPTTLTAAEEARKKKLTTIMGAPNAVRGTSHSGNVSAAALADRSLLDGLSSDYVPASLLHSAFTLADSLSIPLPQTVAMVSANIAATLGLHDRGELQPGKRADVVQVACIDGLPLVKQVFREGVRIA